MEETQTPACGKEEIRAAIGRRLWMRCHAPSMEVGNTPTSMQIIIKELTLVMIKMKDKGKVF